MNDLSEGRVFGDLVVVHFELLGGQEYLALPSVSMLAQGFLNDELAVVGQVLVSPRKSPSLKLYPPYSILKLQQLEEIYSYVVLLITEGVDWFLEAD